MRRTCTQRGASMIELLIACVVLAVVMGAVFGLLQSVIHAWTSQPHASDQLQRLRIAVSSLHDHLAAAGSGIDQGGDGAVALHDYFAPVVPYRLGDSDGDPPGTLRTDVVSLMFVPRRPAFATVVGIHAGAANESTLDIALDCGAAPRPRCGFAPGQQVVVLDTEGRWNRGSVLQADDGRVVVRHLSAMRVRADARPIVAELSMHTYYLAVDRGSGTPQLVHYDGDRTNMPAVDDVVGLGIEYWGEPVPPTVVREAPLPRATYGPAPPAVGVSGEAGWPEGESCTFSVVDGAHVARLAVLGPAGPPVRLPGEIFTDGPWCPGPADLDRYDADLLRLRRLRVRLRVQAMAPWLRRPGRPVAVADAAIQFDVVPRALAVVRPWP